MSRPYDPIDVETTRRTELFHQAVGEVGVQLREIGSVLEAVRTVNRHRNTGNKLIRSLMWLGWVVYNNHPRYQEMVENHRKDVEDTIDAACSPGYDGTPNKPPQHQDPKLLEP